jgi:hypothetical protein
MPPHIHVSAVEEETGKKVIYSHKPNMKKVLQNYKPFQRALPVFTTDYTQAHQTREVAEIKYMKVQPYEPLNTDSQQFEDSNIIGSLELPIVVDNWKFITDIKQTTNPPYYLLSSTPDLMRNNCVTYTIDVLSKMHPLSKNNTIKNLFTDLKDWIIHPYLLMWYLNMHQDLKTDYQKLSSFQTSHNRIIEIYIDTLIGRAEFGVDLDKNITQSIKKINSEIHRNLYNEACYNPPPHETLDNQALQLYKNPQYLPNAYLEQMKEYEEKRRN